MRGVLLLIHFASALIRFAHHIDWSRASGPSSVGDLTHITLFTFVPTSYNLFFKLSIPEAIQDEKELTRLFPQLEAELIIQVNTPVIVDLIQARVFPIFLAANCIGIVIESYTSPD